MKYEVIRRFARILRDNQTPAEKVFWEHVRHRRFMGLKFNRQFVIEHADFTGSKSYFIADFHCFEKKLIVEIDGKVHEQQIKYDKIREDILKEMGYNIIRFQNEEVINTWSEVAMRSEYFITR